MTINLPERDASVTNQLIGEFFDGLTYSGVSKANQRHTVPISKHRSLRKPIKEILASMSNVKA
jgi:hypothetical protein